MRNPLVLAKRKAIGIISISDKKKRFDVNLKAEKSYLRAKRMAQPVVHVPRPCCKSQSHTRFG